MKSRLFKLSIMIIACYGLSACGYYLRGHTPKTALALDGFYLEQGSGYNPLLQAVETLAANQGIKIDSHAPWSMAFDAIEVKQWKASTSQDYSKNQYWLTLSANVLLSHDKTHYQPIALKQQALFQDNVDQLNSKSAEKQQILQELYQKLAEQALQQLVYLASHPPDCDCSDDEN